MAAYSTFVFPTLGGDEQEPSKKFKLCFFPSWVANTKHNPWTNTVEMRESGLEFTQSSGGKNLDNLYGSLVRLLSRKLPPTQLVCVDFTATCVRVVHKAPHGQRNQATAQTFNWVVGRSVVSTNSALQIRLEKQQWHVKLEDATLTKTLNKLDYDVQKL